MTTYKELLKEAKKEATQKINVLSERFFLLDIITFKEFRTIQEVLSAKGIFNTAKI